MRIIQKKLINNKGPNGCNLYQKNDYYCMNITLKPIVCTVITR